MTPLSARLIAAACCGLLLSACADESLPTEPSPQLRPQAALASDADSIMVLYPYHNGYWWDHTHLTVAVKAAPNVEPARLQAVRQAIATWNAFLTAEFGGLITLTDITGTAASGQRADITLHYVPHAGGVVFAGMATCGAQDCPNILVASHFAQFPGYSPRLLHLITLHELGHALGLGHASPLETASDLMGYGWYFNGFLPTMSACNVKALEAVFAWALAGEEPQPPTISSVRCS